MVLNNTITGGKAMIDTKITLYYCKKHDEWYSSNCSTCMIESNEADIKYKERERIIKWLNEPCPHTGGLKEQEVYRSECSKCWQSLKGEK